MLLFVFWLCIVLKHRLLFTDPWNRKSSFNRYLLRSRTFCRRPTFLQLDIKRKLKTGFICLTHWMFRLKNLARVCSFFFVIFLRGTFWGLSKTTECKRTSHLIRSLLSSDLFLSCLSCTFSLVFWVFGLRQGFLYYLHRLSYYWQKKTLPYGMILPPPCFTSGLVSNFGLINVGLEVMAQPQMSPLM